MGTIMDNDLFVALTALVIFFVIVGLGITLFVLYYYKKRSDYISDKKLIIENFEKTILPPVSKFKKKHLKPSARRFMII